MNLNSNSRIKLRGFDKGIKSKPRIDTINFGNYEFNAI